MNLSHLRNNAVSFEVFLHYSTKSSFLYHIKAVNPHKMNSRFSIIGNHSNLRSVYNQNRNSQFPRVETKNCPR